ncbi:MAG: hypothetical protein AAFO04_29880 [Cyanobacteria bacterium J06592_8]
MMNEHQLIANIQSQPSDYQQTVFFSIVDEKDVSDDPLIQAVHKLDPNAQIRILSAINGAF